MVCGVCEADASVKKVDGVSVVLKDYNERRSTDVIFFILLIGTWIAMTVLGIDSGKRGNPAELTSPYDDSVSAIRVTYLSSSAFNFH